MMMMDMFRRIMLFSLIPAVVLVPYWFGHGRELLGGTIQFYGSFYLGDLCMPGVVVFHVLMILWQFLCFGGEEQSMVEKFRPTQAVALLLLYGFHVVFQIYFFDEDSNHMGGWSVASKYFGIDRHTSIINSLVAGTIIFVLMVFIILWGFFFPYNETSTSWMIILRKRMYQTIAPGVIVAPLWFSCGHVVLGAGYGWGMILMFIMNSLPIVLPFHIFLWCQQVRRNRNQNHLEEEPPNNTRNMTSPTLSIALMIYYGLMLIFQPFVWEGFRSGSSTATGYYGMSDDLSNKIDMTFRILMLLLIIFMIIWMCCFDDKEYHNDNSTLLNQDDTIEGIEASSNIQYEALPIAEMVRSEQQRSDK